MTSSRSRRAIIACASGLLVFALVVASAASLGGLTSDNLGAEDSVVASCDSDGVTTTYSTVYNTTGSGGFKVDDVTVDGIDNACDGQTMTITLSGSGGTSLGSDSLAVPSNVGATTNVIDFVAENVLAEDVTGIHIVITG